LGVAYDPVVLLSATNIALPLPDWTAVATNHFNSSGNTGFTNLISADEPTRFFGVAVE
jgi:hypothetical protein